MSKAKPFFAIMSIVAILLAVSHVIHFVGPLIQMSDEEGNIPQDTGDDLTTYEFLELAQFFENYDWANYNPDDFPAWIYMPDALNETEFVNDDWNISQSGVPPFYGYDWDTYDPTDFPNWLIMPETLPTDFNRTSPTYVEEFVFDHIDPSYYEAMEDAMSDLAGIDSPEDALSGDNFDLGSAIGSIISVWELIYAILNIGAALIFFIISRSVA